MTPPEAPYYLLRRSILIQICVFFFIYTKLYYIKLHNEMCIYEDARRSEKFQGYPRDGASVISRRERSLAATAQSIALKLKCVKQRRASLRLRRNNRRLARSILKKNHLRRPEYQKLTKQKQAKHFKENKTSSCPSLEPVSANNRSFGQNQLRTRNASGQHRTNAR